MERKKFLDKIAASEGKERLLAILDYSKYLRSIDPEESVNQAKIAFEEANKNPDTERELNALAYICTSYFYVPDFKQVKYWADKLMTAGKEHKNYKAIGDSYNMDARIFYQMGDMDKAQEILLQALDNYLKTDSDRDKISCYNALGIIHLAKEESEEAKYYLELALEIAEEAGSDSVQSIRINLSNILFQQSLYEAALRINQEILEFYQERDMHNQSATALNNIGLCYYHLGNNSSSIEYLDQAHALYKNTGQMLDLCRCCYNMAKVYIAKEEFKDSKKLLEESLTIAKENNFKNELTSIYNVYSKYYEKLKDFEIANEYLRKSYENYAVNTKESHQEKIDELETKYKTQIYKLKNTELDKKNKIMSKQIEELNFALNEMKKANDSLQTNFQKINEKMYSQEDIFTAQSRVNEIREVLSTIAHQWKQPLSIIWVMVQAIMDAWKYDDLNEEFMDNQVKQIGDQVNYMSETINDFRNYFHQGEEKEFQVKEVIEKSLKLTEYLITKCGITLNKDIDKECILYGNPNELSQVLINVVNNARQSIERNKPDQPKIIIQLSCDTQYAIIKIFNTGRPIKENQLSKIFEPYFTTREEGGTGLGLHICRQIIENKYKGSIHAENHIDGAEFIIKLPLTEN